MATTLAPVLNELVAPCRRTPFPSESYWKCSRSGRTTVQPIGSEHPGSSRGASPALDTHRRGRRIQHSPRICLGIPIAFRQEERHEATTRTRAPEPKSLSHQTGRRSCSFETCVHGKFANGPVRTAVSSVGRDFAPIATRSASRAVLKEFGCYVEFGGKALTTQHIWWILLNISPARIRLRDSPQARIPARLPYASALGTVVRRATGEPLLGGTAPLAARDHPGRDAREQVQAVWWGTCGRKP